MLRIVSRPIRVLAGLLVLASLGSCALKDSDFFTYTDSGFPGGIHVVVDGIPGGAAVTLNGEEGLLGTHVVDLSGYRFAPLLTGTYSLSIAVPMGFVCDKTSQNLSYVASDTDAEVAFVCMETPGTVSFTSTGITGSTSFGLSLMDGTTLNGSLGSSGATFMNVHPGHWSWSLGSTTGFTCMPTSGEFDLAAGGTVTQMIDCVSDLGGLSVAVTGTGMTHMVAYSGPENGSVQAGETPVSVSVMPGDYLLSLTAPDGYTCPSTQSATVSAGQTASVTFACTPQPGTVNVTVSGATADVSYTGPSNGMVSAGSTPVPVTGLAAGDYTFTITDPSGFSCTPASVPVTLAAGATESAQFACTAVVASDYTLDFTMLYNPGIVSGARTGDLLLGGSVTGSYVADPGGPGNNYFGWSPYRFGFDAGNWWTFRNFTVGGSNYEVSHVEFCATTGFSGSNFLDVTYLDDLSQTLGTGVLSSGPGCFAGDAPAGTTSFRIRGNGAGSFDINGLLISGVSW